MTVYAALNDKLKNDRKTSLISRVTGFTGSNLPAELLLLGPHVVGLDHFSTGKQKNLDTAQQTVSPDACSRFRLERADTRKSSDYRTAFVSVDYVLHQAALGKRQDPSGA